MAGKVIDVTGADFAEVTGQSGWTLFDLWSPTCAPCRTLATVLDDLASDFSGEVRMCKVDVSADEALGERFAAQALPTLALYRDGQEVDRIVGGRSRAQLNSWLESHL